LKELLADAHRYYYFDQDVIFEDGGKQKRRFLVLECDPSVVDEVYDIIADKASHLYESFYRGFAGLILIFDITLNTKDFDVFMENLKDTKNMSESIIEHKPQ
jgi:hypothetical protein